MSVFEPASPDVTKWRSDAELNDGEFEDVSPIVEMICQLWWFIKFMGYASLFFFCVFCAWAVFEHFNPSTACMVQMIFSINCK